MTATDETAQGVDEKTVPAERNFGSDMGLTSKLITADRGLVTAPLTAAVASPAGCASAGMLMTLIDIGASDPALAGCSPDWTATQDLSLYGVSWLREGPIVVDNRLLRVGRRVIVVAADVYDAHGMDDFDDIERALEGDTRMTSAAPLELAARGVCTFARITRAAATGVDDYDPASWVGQVRWRAADSPPAGTQYERMGIQRLDDRDGVLELANSPYVANSIGTINGGAQAIMIEAAAEAMRPGLTASDMQIHYLSQVKVGPARSRGTVVRDAPDHSVVDIELVDAGNDDQVLAIATVTLRRAT